MIAALIPLFRAAGFRVSTVKHAHHGVALDKPGKDSFIHAEAGAQEVILTTQDGFALFSRTQTPLADLLPRLAPVDLVLVEGFKAEALPRLAVYWPALGKPAPWPDPHLLAVATDSPLPDCPLPVLLMDQPQGIVDFLISALGLSRVGS